MSIEVLRAQWLNRRVLVERYGRWSPARVTWVSDDGGTVSIDYEVVLPDGAIRAWVSISDLVVV